MKKTSKTELFFGVLLSAGLLPLCAAQSDQRLDGIWIGTEKLLVARTDCPKPSHETLPAEIAVAQGGSLLAVVEGYGFGRYIDIHWSGDTLVFQNANKRRGELRLSPDGKTLIEKGFVRRTATGFTPCVDELTGTFHRER
jgi:hypothetical protein